MHPGVTQTGIKRHAWNVPPLTNAHTSSEWSPEEVVSEVSVHIAVFCDAPQSVRVCCAGQKTCSSASMTCNVPAEQRRDVKISAHMLDWEKVNFLTKRR